MPTKLEGNTSPPASSESAAVTTMPQHNIIKKQGVSGESCDVNIVGSSDILIRKFEKDFK